MFVVQETNTVRFECTIPSSRLIFRKIVSFRNGMVDSTIFKETVFKDNPKIFLEITENLQGNMLGNLVYKK